jgi:transposase
VVVHKIGGRQKVTKNNAKIKVKIPMENISIISRNNHKYVRYILNAIDGKWWDSITKKKKNINTIMIGTVCSDDESMMFPNDNYFATFGVDSFDDLDDPNLSFDDIMSFGSSYVLRYLSDTCGLTTALVETFGEELANRILALSFYSISEKTNVAQHFENWSFDHYTGLLKNFSDSTINVIYKEKITEELIDEFHKKWIIQWKTNCLKKLLPNKTIVYLDSTNITTSSPSIDNAEQGHAKKKDGFPQVNTAVLMSETTSHPLAMYQYRGAQIDNTSLIEIIKYSQEIGLKDCFFVADRGYHSANNVKELSKQKFAIMCSENNNATVDNILANIGIYFKVHNKVRGYDAYCIDYQSKSFYDSDLHVYVYVDSDTKHLEAKHLMEKVEKYEKFLLKKNKKEEWMESSYGKFFIFRDKEPNQKDRRNFSLERREETIQEELDKCGFFVVLSNDNEIDNAQMLSIMRHRAIIENGFRHWKTDFDMEKARIQSDEVMLSKTFIGFVSLIIKKDGLERLKSLLKNSTDNETFNSLLQALDKIKIQYKNERWSPRNRLTGKCQKIFKTLGIKEETILKYIKNIPLKPE